MIENRFAELKAKIQQEGSLAYQAKTVYGCDIWELDGLQYISTDQGWHEVISNGEWHVSLKHTNSYTKIDMEGIDGDTFRKIVKNFIAE